MIAWLVVAAQAGSGTVIVGYDSEPPTRAIEALGGTVRRCFRSSAVCLVEGVSVAALRRVPGVRHADPDAQTHLANAGSVTPTSQCPDPWGLQAIEVEAAWL